MVVAPVIVGVAAWMSPVALRDPEDRTRSAEVKADQISGDLQQSIRLGIALYGFGGKDTARLERLAGTPLSGGVTATIVAAAWPGDASKPEAALRVTDARMYAAKRQRRERSHAA